MNAHEEALLMSLARARRNNKPGTPYADPRIIVAAEKELADYRASLRPKPIAKAKKAPEPEPDPDTDDDDEDPEDDEDEPDEEAAPTPEKAKPKKLKAITYGSGPTALTLEPPDFGRDESYAIDLAPKSAKGKSR